MQPNYKGFANLIGFGERPAVLVIDFINGFTDVDCPLGSDYAFEIEHTVNVLEEARDCGIPIVFTTVVYDNFQDEGAYFGQKIPALQYLMAGSRWIELDQRLKRKQHELLLKKKFASAFFGTSLQSILTAKKIDTVIVAGCTTSGCVRATVVDALQHGYRVIVPEQCVGDRSLDQHKANLFDIHNKYGDVVSSDEVIHYVKSLKEEVHDV